MTIKYADGATVEALLLSRTENTLRVMHQGDEDVHIYTRANEAWVSEGCEPILIEFHWQRRSKTLRLAEADCICSKQLAARLISMLLQGEEPANELDASSSLPATSITQASAAPVQ
jgi:hypothetical protein